jgi:hypothetical protein
MVSKYIRHGDHPEPPEEKKIQRVTGPLMPEHV